MGAISNAYAWMAMTDERKRDHYAQAIENLYMVLEEPDQYCMSGYCDDTSWGGMDRLHYRGRKCPEFSERETRGDLERAKKSYEALDRAS